MSIQSLCTIYDSFCEMYIFPLGVFSIYNINLHNLNGNRNVATVSFGVWLLEMGVVILGLL